MSRWSATAASISWASASPIRSACSARRAALQEKHGPKRVLDMPIAENAMTGVALGSALVGMRPVMTHMRLEFAMTAIDQICNQAGKWHYMFGGQSQSPAHHPHDRRPRLGSGPAALARACTPGSRIFRA